jgi:hypothetical protein
MSRVSRAQVAVGLWRAQAKRWQAQATRLQADNTRLQARVAELEDKVERLTEQVARLGRVAFGGSSQKQAVAPAAAVAVAAGGGPGGGGKGMAGGVGVVSSRDRRGHGRRDYWGLPRVEVTREVAQAERVCPRCGRRYTRSGAEHTELIDWQVTLRRVVVRRPRWRRACRCPVAAWLVAPPPPRPIPRAGSRRGCGPAAPGQGRAWPAAAPYRHGTVP